MCKRYCHCPSRTLSHGLTLSASWNLFPISLKKCHGTVLPSRGELSLSRAGGDNHTPYDPQQRFWLETHGKCNSVYLLRQGASNCSSSTPRGVLGLLQCLASPTTHSLRLSVVPLPSSGLPLTALLPRFAPFPPRALKCWTSQVSVPIFLIPSTFPW